MDKEAVVHIYSGIVLSHKQEHTQVLVRWMTLEPVIQGELSQKEKDRYHTLAHVYGI